MKNKLIIFLLLFTGYLFPVSSFAFSWSNIFPPIKMSRVPYYSNPPVVKTIETGSQGVSNKTFVNKFDNTKTTEVVVCKGETPVSNSWAAKEQNIFDSLGNVINTIFKYPYDAKDLRGQELSHDQSNNFPRKIQAEYLGRWETNIDIDKISTNFKEMGISGSNLLSKIYSVDQLHFFQGEALKEMIKTVYNIDTNYADIQRGWDCNGTFEPVDDTPRDTTCRPITALEVVCYASQNPQFGPIFFTDAATMTPEPIPGEVCEKIKTNYKARFNKNIPNLSGDYWNTNYTKIYQQLPIKALGPIGQQVTVTNYKNICNQWPDYKPCEGTNKSEIRNIPFLSPGNPMLTNQLSSINNQFDDSLGSGENGNDISNQFATPFDCENVIVNGKPRNVVDKPNSISIWTYALGMYRAAISDEPKFSATEQNPKKIETEISVVKSATQVTNDLANILPAGYDEAKKLYDSLKNLPPSSVVKAGNPHDAGFQTDQVFDSVRSYLHPQAWQDNYPAQF